MVLILKNKKATFNYEILDTYSAGLKLTGTEVKSLKTGKGGSLAGSFIVFKDNELWIKGMHIPPYQPKNTPESYDPDRIRKLLIQKNKIKKIGHTITTEGLTAIPIAVHNTGRISLEFAIARGKKKHDKRETIRKREDEIRIRREHKIRW